MVSGNFVKGKGHRDISVGGGRKPMDVLPSRRKVPCRLWTDINTEALVGGCAESSGLH